MLDFRTIQEDDFADLMAVCKSLDDQTVNI